jgi:hypothetical protein
MDRRPIPGYEGYTASEDGKIYGKKGQEIGSYDKSEGYTRIDLQTDLGRLQTKRHILIARTFLGPRPEGLQIDHIDRNRQNDQVENLRYVTRSENTLNKGFNKNSKTRVKGLCCHLEQYWKCSLMVNGISHLKYFPLDQRIEAEEWLTSKREEIGIPAA